MFREKLIQYFSEPGSLSKVEFAKRVGVSRGYLYQLMEPKGTRGKQIEPTLNVASKIAKLAGFCLSEVMEQTTAV